MGDTTEQQLRRALTAFGHPRTPGRIMELLRTDGVSALDGIYSQLPGPEMRRVEEQVLRLLDDGVDVLFWGDDRYPRQLLNAPGAPPILFVRGNEQLLEQPGISMCGSRNVSEQGLQAAAACGYEVARYGMVVMSGYARGVDMETHLAALNNDGTTVIVLAEGINHFRIKKALPRELFTRERVVVVSQFPPSQPWSAGAAMTRNAVIVGLGLALVVIEAGDKGGTLAAGQHALRAGRPVFVLDFGDSTPPGNRILLQQGATAVTSRPSLGTALDRLAPEPEVEQLRFG